ncbi:hypothetical protein [Streptomyces halobius]|uniref:Uncharacterized protein n=1 Tax=Streptomyces halobius TaxID=2879846 RepID=A0ABY4MI18_9ACTN|nr:hypothetical protein [Streptomyces halobius]UQA97444.1 hypothetical protein K9S39_41300 [Streptomyces halobius]
MGKLAALIRDRRARSVPATELIAPGGRPDAPLGPFGTRLADVLPRHVEVSDIDDGISFYETFADRLAEARTSVFVQVGVGQPIVILSARAVSAVSVPAVGSKISVMALARRCSTASASAGGSPRTGSGSSPVCSVVLRKCSELFCHSRIRPCLSSL